MILYNLFPTLAGSFDTWRPHLERAAQMGFNWIFVNPVQRPGASGSLYSIADHFALNPLLVDTRSSLSGEEQLRYTITHARGLGLELMVDLVINHCASDAEITRQHPEWFLKDASGVLANAYCLDNGERVVWKDLVSFDHKGTSDPQGLYQFVRQVAERLLEVGFRGFRCDAAYHVPAALWKRLISDVRAKHGHVVFAAETLGCTPNQTQQTAQSGFDYVFNSSKWWDFSSPWLLQQHALVREISPTISFPESHDTPRLFEESAGSLGALKQRYLFAAFISSGLMLPVGYEFGFRRPLHVVETRPEDWETAAIDLQAFIGRVNALKSKHGVLREDGPLVVLPSANPQVLWLWKASVKSGEEAMLVLNKDIWQRQPFCADNLDAYLQNGGRLVDVSPEYPVDHVRSPFVYDLNPGQGLVLLATPR
jgi:starch synthase (maltosyl-transferring)